MNKRFIGVLLASVMLLPTWTCIAEETSETRDASRLYEAISSEYFGRYIVKYKSEGKNLSDKEIDDAFLEAKSCSSLNSNDDEIKSDLEEQKGYKLSAYTLSSDNITDEYIDNNIQVIQLDEPVPAEEFIEELSAGNSNIEYIQPDYPMSLASATYGEEMYDTHESFQPIEDIALTAVSREPQEPLDEVVVALIDTGVDVDHPELRDKTVQGYDFCNNTSNVYADTCSINDIHGTHIAGIISSNAYNSKVMPLKVFENGKALTSDIIRAISFAKENGAAIVNCSWGASEYNAALKQVMYESGLIFICAAGNSGSDLEEKPIYPACYDIDSY